MHGDMMLTIANEKIDTHKHQSNLRCLVCYVAEKPLTKREDYHEEYSYLNDGHPFNHDRNMHAARFRAKSNVFYLGCNIDDFFTFCLKLSHNTGEVTLSHAGPNGIYNHEKIYYKFNKTYFDLSRIDYIHVSGGNQDVPIRNLTIDHERLSDLHPSFNESFTIDTSGLQRNRRPSVDRKPPNPRYGNPSSNYKGGASETRKLRSVSVPSPPRKEKPRLLSRIKRAILGLTVKDNPPAPGNSPSEKEKFHSPSAKPKYDGARDELSPYNRPRDKTSPRTGRRDESPPKSPSLRISNYPPPLPQFYLLSQSKH